MLDPPPRGLFAPSLHHSSLSSLTPALLSGLSFGLSEHSQSWAGISWSPDLFVFCFLLSAPRGKTPVSFVYQSLKLTLVLLLTAENLSSRTNSWGLFNFRHVYLLWGAIKCEADKEIHKHRPQKCPRWPLPSSGELELRSLLHFDRACFAMCSLLDSGYLYYPITTLHSGLCPALEDTGRISSGRFILPLK